MDRLSDRENRQLSFEQQRRQDSIIAIEATGTTEASRAYAGMAALMGSYFDAIVLKLSDFFTAEGTHPNRRHTLYTLLQRASPEAIAHVTLRQIVRSLTGYERNGQEKDGSAEDDDRSPILHTNIATKIGKALRQLPVAQQQQQPIVWCDTYSGASLPQEREEVESYLPRSEAAVCGTED